jgi:hypothetical protein
LDVLANASERVRHEPTVDASLYPSQLLHVEALRRPIESTRQRLIRSMHRSEEEPGLRIQLGALSQLSLSPRGEHLAALAEGADSSSVFELELKHPRLAPRKVLEAVKEGHPGQVQQGEQSGEIFFLQGSRLLWLRAGRICQLANLREPLPAGEPPCRPLTTEQSARLTLSEGP